MSSGASRCVLFGALCVSGSAPAWSQVTTAPDSLRVTLPQGQEATLAVTLSNAGAAAILFCLDFDRPLQRENWSSLGLGCGVPGELLDVFDEGDLGDNWDPYGITMTPDGRIFVAEYGRGSTYEFTAALTYVREFQHPRVAELAPFPVTVGVTHNEDTNTLWWTNAEESGSGLHRVLLLEGTFDGVATGRRIELPIPPVGPPPTNTGYPVGAAYDAATKRFYYADALRDELWAVDTLGVVVAGYPVTLAAYPAGRLGNDVDVHGGSEGGPEGVRIEVAVGLLFDLQYDRIVVTDPSGSDLGVETPLTTLTGGSGGPKGASVRSLLDPNSVMYVPFSISQNGGVAAMRPAPLPPTWLTLPAWSGTIAVGGNAQFDLTFRAGNREPREYRSTLVVEDTAGVVLASVPLTLVVEAGTPVEPPPADAGMALVVSPNPVAGAGAVTVNLPAAVPAVRVVVFDVLGREVGVRHDGPLPAGATRLALAELPVGVYVVRAEAAGRAVAARFVVAGPR